MLPTQTWTPLPGQNHLSCSRFTVLVFHWKLTAVFVSHLQWLINEPPHAFLMTHGAHSDKWIPQNKQHQSNRCVSSESRDESAFSPWLGEQAGKAVHKPNTVQWRKLPVVLITWMKCEWFFTPPFPRQTQHSVQVSRSAVKLRFITLRVFFWNWQRCTRAAMGSFVWRWECTSRAPERTLLREPWAFCFVL